MPDAHTPILPDVLEPGLDLVFCGTAPSARSARDAAYYAHPGNYFWRTLHHVGLTPRLYAPSEFTGLPALGIGLTDLAKRHAGNDDQLPGDAFDVPALMAKLERYRPGVIAFTSKHAAQSVIGHAVNYGLQRETLSRVAVFVLPSPSGQARRFWDRAHWQALADRIGGGR